MIHTFRSALVPKEEEMSETRSCRLFWLLTVLALLSGCGTRDMPLQQPQSGEPSPAEIVQEHVDQWAEVADSGALLGFLPEGADPSSPPADELLDQMGERLLALCRDTPEVREQIAAITAQRPETAAEAASCFAQGYFELMQPRAEALAKQYIWGFCVPYWELWQREYSFVEGLRPAAFIDAQIEKLVPGGVFSRDGACYLVYTLDFLLLPEAGAAPVIMGGMGQDELGWLHMGLWDIMALSLESSGALSFCFSEKSDTVPSNGKHFPADFARMLTNFENGTGNWWFEWYEVHNPALQTLSPGMSPPDLIADTSG